MDVFRIQIKWYLKDCAGFRLSNLSFFELLLPFTKEQCIMCKEKEKWKRIDENRGHLLINAGKLNCRWSFTRRGSAGKRYSLVYEMQMSFFSFHMMNEKVKIREPWHTVAQPLSLEEERFISFIKQTVVVSTKGTLLFFLAFLETFLDKW